MFKLGIKLRIIPPNAQHKSAPLGLTKDFEYWYSQFSCLTFIVKRQSKERIRVWHYVCRRSAQLENRKVPWLFCFGQSYLVNTDTICSIMYRHRTTVCIRTRMIFCCTQQLQSQVLKTKFENTQKNYLVFRISTYSLRLYKLNIKAISFKVLQWCK